jgi:hypothetical protein
LQFKIRKVGKMLKFAWTFILISSFLSVSAQILDDSTKQVYGPSSVYYIYENELLDNLNIKNHPDTLIDKFYKTNPNHKLGWLYQDLGNVGTASKPLLFEPLKNIATQNGYDVFSLYAPKTKNIKYYNTRSPFSNLMYIQGFKGYSQLDFTHSQNINERWNITLDVEKYNSSKQIDASTAEDRLVNHWSYDISSNYISKNKKYTFLGAFYHFNHKQTEQGGILAQENLSIEPKDLLANYRSNYSSQLTTGVFSSERWNNLHIFQQYKLKNGFQAFHVMDYERKKNFFHDPAFQTNFNSTAYNLSLDSTQIDTLNQNSLFAVFSNQFGLKGRYRGFDYRMYAKQRFFKQTSIYGDQYASGLKSESFIGGQLAYYFKDSTNRVIAEAEFSTNLGYFLNGEITFKNFKGQFYQSFSPVGLFYSQYYTPLNEWRNILTNPFNTFIKGTFDFNYSGIYIKPGARYTIYSNYIYLDQKQKITQNSSLFNTLSFDLNLGYSTKKFKFSNEFTLTINSAENILRIPRIINNSNVEFLLRYAKVLNIYTGADIFYRSAYFADAYSPVLQHFYLQDNFKVWGTAVVDPYLAFQVNRVRLSFKFEHANQGLGNQGFYVTPYYLAMPRAFSIKVNWPLFD